MFGGLLKTTSRLSVAAATGLFLSSTAYAGGSIGGDCCADLEERVAELEATTARKGNRKVSLTVSGHVNKAILYQDFNNGMVWWHNIEANGIPDEDVRITSHDGELQIIDNPLSQSRFRLTGNASITSDLSVGYKLEFGVAATSGGAALSLRQNDLYIASKTLGKFSIGHGNAATEGIAEIDLSGTDIAGGSSSISGMDNLDGGRSERVRYDTPTIAGFVLSASWEENEDFDVALRHGSSLGDFTIAAGIGYSEQSTDVKAYYYNPLFGLSTDPAELTTVSGSASIAHVPTGINLTFAAGEREYDFGFGTADTEFWYIKGGIKRNVFGIGATAFSVDYHQTDSFIGKLGNATIGDSFGDQFTREKFGVQLVQNIDAAATELYASFWTIDSNATFAGQDMLEEDGFMAGARIKF